MKAVTLYTDGACSGNPGPGGWGAVLIYKSKRLEMSGYDPATTNNRMELMAAIQGLSALKEPCQVDLYSDSSYLVNAFEKHWLTNWQKRGWLKADKKPVENQDLWQTLLTLSMKHQIHWHKVKGHSDNVENNRCDQLATGEIKQKRKAESLD
ncbi:ribonuclease HI [Eubacteriales bacterium OttesenSCG-928-N13]|nr:ribonuclease HI [Eubacteriales bacterium OttesenSCG-928-N13]